MKPMPPSSCGSKRSQCMGLPTQLHEYGCTDATIPLKKVCSRAGTIQRSLSAQPTNMGANEDAACSSHASILATHWNCGKLLTYAGRVRTAI